MRDRLPPLHALRTFEVAARHLSYSRAAEELNVTHSAVSRQIRVLEEYLDAELFQRSGRAMLLTNTGERLYTHVREGFGRLQDGVGELRAKARRRVLTIGVLPGFAVRWLVPRLPGFSRAHPDTVVNLRASMTLTDFSREEVDLAIRFGPGSWPGLNAEKLLDEHLIPVCSPRYRGGRLPRTPRELLQCTLLHEVSEPWHQWFLSVGLTPPAIQRGPEFSESNLLLRAATEAQGVALALGTLVQKELDTGELVQCFPGLRARYAYYLVHPKMAAPPRVTAFKTWLKAQAQTHRLQKY
jgi:LysR family glycine cleavage system transcriptional activator